MMASHHPLPRVRAQAAPDPLVLAVQRLTVQCAEQAHLLVTALREISDLRLLLIEIESCLPVAEPGVVPPPQPAVRLDHRYGPSLSLLAERVALKTGVAVSALRGASREKPIAMARFILCADARRAGFSLARIGRFLGGRDHSTIAGAVSREDGARAFYADVDWGADP